MLVEWPIQLNHPLVEERVDQSQESGWICSTKVPHVLSSFLGLIGQHGSIQTCIRDIVSIGPS